jgi:hypothetical protein
MVEKSFSPWGALILSPLGTRTGGHTLAHSPVQVTFPFGSAVKRYSVSPLAVVKTVPNLAMCWDVMVTAWLDDTASDAPARLEPSPANASVVRPSVERPSEMPVPIQVDR